MRLVNFNSIDRVLSYEKYGNYNDFALPEICFAGRSNVGKSSLINCLLNRKSLARVSKKPGQTKKIIFYRVDKYFSLVDLPGYGYANVSKKKIDDISELLYSYFINSRKLKRVYVLIDSRHGIKRNDLEFLSFLNKNELIYRYIFTKSDKLSEVDRKKILNDNLRKISSTNFAHTIFTSSKTKEGMKELKANMLKVISENEEKS